MILHGLNTSSGAKHSEGNHPWISESDVDREYREFGFNCVRYLIFWGAIEPEKGVYDRNYLAEVKKRVKWYTDREMYVILDMHQDVYGYGVGGNGAPEWACNEHKINNLVPDKWPWWMQNMEPKVIRFYVQFFKYKKQKELQDHYIAAFQEVAKTFHDNPYVIGYDLMNEPHGGKIVKTLSGRFEKKQVSAFYERLIPALREVEPDKYLFFEPRAFGVNFGMKSGLPKVEDARKEPRLVYAPHFYPKFIDVGTEYGKKPRKEVANWFKRRDQDQQRHQAPVLVGEFGLSPSKTDFDVFLDDFHRTADARHYSWTYWSNDPGGWSPLDGNREPIPILPELLRIYPQKTAGKLISYAYDADLRRFQMSYVAEDCEGMPTVIALPPYQFSGVSTVWIENGGAYRVERDSDTGAVLLWVEAGRKVEVEIICGG